MGVAALLGLVAVAATPEVPWSSAALFLVFGVAAVRVPRLARIGVVAAWTSGFAAFGVAGLGVLLVVGALRWTRLSSGLVGLALLLAARQGVASRELAAAREPVPELVVTLVIAAAAWSAADPRALARWKLAASPRVAAGALAATGLVVLVRLGLVFQAEGVDRLRAAEHLQAVPLVYRGLVEAAPSGPEGVRLLAELVRAAPDRDEAASRLPWETALALGWRPDRGGDAVIEVALALEARGRGGEALRLLARHPREGAVDWYRGLLERTQGVEARWRGGTVAGVPELPGRVALDRRWEANTYEALLVHLVAPVPAFVLTGSGTPYQGDPVVDVRVDASPTRSWVLRGAGRIELPGPFATGPHRIELRFASDRVGPDGDRNVVIEALAAEAARPEGSDPHH